jgi:hypothetical protein
MSNYWDLHCRDCNVGAGLHANRADRELADLIKHLPVIAGLHGTGLAIELPFSTEGGTHDLPEFAAQHRDHHVGVRSEYGYYHDGCQEHWTCAGCGETRMNCGKKAEHEGVHGPADSASVR